MKLRRVSYSKMAGFLGGELDLRTVPHGLVALAGRNFQGKTWLLELILACLYRELASRGTNDVTRWADARDSWVECEVELADGVYRARVNIDGPARKSHAVLSWQRPDGQWQLLTDGKVSTFDAAVAERFPPKDALLCSQFAAQNRAGSLTGQSRSARKDLFIQFLGLGRLIALSETAKQCVAIAETTRSVLTERSARLEETCTPDREAELQTARAAIVLHQDTVQSALLGVEAELREAETEGAALQAQVEAYVEASTRAAAITTRVTAIDRERAELPVQVTRLSEKAQLELDELEVRNTRIAAMWTKKIDGYDALAARGPEIRAAVAERAEVQAALTRWQQEDATTMQARLDLTTVYHDATSAETVETVPCHGEPAFAGCPFLTDALAAKNRVGGRTAASVAGDLQVLGVASQSRLAARGSAEARFQALTPLAQQEAQLDQVEERLAEARESQALDREDGELRLAAVKDRVDAAVQAIGERDRVLEVESDALKAEAELVQETVAATAHARARRVELDELLAQLRAGVRLAEKELAALTASRDGLDEKLATLADQRAQWVQLQPRRALVDDALRVHSLIARACHRNGLPTLEIAAAAPALSQLTTDLLEHSGFGTRFRVSVTTLVPTADGKDWKEDFAIRVYDNTRGKEILDPGDLSGGERILVEEALRSALTIYMSTRGTQKVRSCWRDECTGPLDAENRPRYIDMLRRLMQLGEFDHVLFISQTADCVELADTIFDVTEGRAERRV